MKTMRPLLFSLFLVLVSVAYASAVTIYGTAYSGSSGPATLYTIDPSTGVATLVGLTGYNRVGAIDFDPSTGVLYGVGTVPTTSMVDLISINTATGAGTAIGATGTDTFQDISFRSDGTLFGFSAGNIYTINLTTGAATLIGATGVDFNTSRGNALAFDPSNTLYQIDRNVIRTIDTTTGMATDTGTTVNYPIDLGVNPRTNAMDFDLTTGTLYASIFSLSDEAIPENFIAEIDLATGTVTDPQITVSGLDGLAVLPTISNSVPETMSTLWLALPLLGLFAFGRLRSQSAAASV